MDTGKEAVKHELCNSNSITRVGIDIVSGRQIYIQREKEGDSLHRLSLCRIMPEAEGRRKLHV